MNKQIGSTVIYARWHWTIWRVSFTWEPAIRREDGSKHTQTELYFALGPLHLGVYW